MGSSGDENFQNVNLANENKSEYVTDELETKCSTHSPMSTHLASGVPVVVSFFYLEEVHSIWTTSGLVPQ